ncbi:MAG TPA: hypothetical protein VIT23_12430, partial [Terrimicrobiaceae bacterium]
GVRKFEQSGQCVAKFDFAIGTGAIAVNKSDGIIYYLPRKADTIIKATLQPDGKYLLESYVGTPGCSDTDGIAIDDDGNLYHAGTTGIRKYAPDGRHLGEVVNWPMNSARKALAIDSKKNLYFSYSVAGRQELFRQDLHTNKLDSLRLGACDAIAIDSSDNLYIADFRNGTITRRGQDGAETLLPGHYGDLQGIACHGNQLYISNGIDGILKVDLNGICSGTKLFSLEYDHNYFVKCSDGFYASCGGTLFHYDNQGNRRTIWEGGHVAGVALDDQGSLLFNGYMDNGKGWKVHWRPTGHFEVATAAKFCGNLEGLAVSIKSEGNAVAKAFFADVQYKCIRQVDLKSDRDFSPAPYWAIAGGAIGGPIEGLKGVAATNNEDVYFVHGTLLGRAKRKGTGFEVNNGFIPGLVEPRAVAVDPEGNVYVTNEGSQPHAGKYNADGKHLCDLTMPSAMKNLRDLCIDKSDRGVIVLQKDGIWKYTNAFAKLYYPPLN